MTTAAHNPVYVTQHPTPPGNTPKEKMSDFQLYKRLMTYLMPYKKRFVLGLLSTIPSAALSGAAAYLIGQLVDQLIQTENYDLLMLVPVALIIFYLLESVFSYISTYYTSYIGTAISQDLREALYKKLSHRDLKYLTVSSIGDLQSRYYNDPARLQLAIVNNLQTFVLQGATAIALAGVLIYRSWEFALVALGVISLIVIPITMVSKKLRVLDGINQEISARMFNVFHESILGARVIAIFNLYSHQEKRFRQSNNEFFGNAMSLIKASAMLRPATQMVSAVGIACILWFGTWKLQQGQMSPGDLTSFLVALVLLYKPIKTVAGIVSRVQRILAPAERVFEKLDMPPTLPEPDSPVGVDNFESLAFNNVDFAYTDDHAVLTDINLTLKRGEVVALVGESGGGKSTLVDLIPRFMDPTRGIVTMNGIDLKQINLRDIRRHVSMVSQDTLLFEGSVVENIRLGKLTATDAEIAQAIKVAHLQTVIDSLPEGIDSQIGPGGALLSGGQKQRIAIARAFLKDAPVIILDEATSALDNESEAAVQDGMKTLMAGKTVIVIAHRLSTIRHADRILVVDKGCIREEGTHDALIAQDGLYKRLHSLQFRHDGLATSMATAS